MKRKQKQTREKEKEIVFVVFDDQIIELMLKLELTSSWYYQIYE